MLFRASTILRTRGRKSSTDDIAGTVSTATRSRRTATKRSRSGATTRSTTRKRAPAKAASASSSRGGKGGRGRRASVNETAEPATEKGRAAHHGLINLIALAIKKDKVVTAPQFRRAMNMAKEKGLVEQLLQHFILTDKAKREMKLRLSVGSKQAEERMEEEQHEHEASEEEAKKHSTPESTASKKATSATRASSSKKAAAGSRGGRGTATKRAPSTKSSGGRAKKARTSIA